MPILYNDFGTNKTPEHIGPYKNMQHCTMSQPNTQPPK